MPVGGRRAGSGPGRGSVRTLLSNFSTADTLTAGQVASPAKVAFPNHTIFGPGPKFDTLDHSSNAISLF